MGGSKFIPIVVAGFVGLLIGWWSGPDIDDARDEIVEKVEAVAGSVGEIGRKVDAAAGGTEQAVAPLNTKLDALSAEVTKPAQNGETQAQLQAIANQLTALDEKISAAPAPAPAPAPAGGDVATLVGTVGPGGAILLPGQSAVFGGQGVTLSAISEAGATLGPAGSPGRQVAPGASLELGTNCRVTLAGVAAGLGFLKPEGCTAAGGNQTAAAAPAPAPPASAAPAPAPAPQQQAAAPSPSPSPAPAAPAAAGDSYAIGQTAAFGEKRLFVSAVGENSVTLFPAGGRSGDRKTIEQGATFDAGDGCIVTLAGVEAGRAKLTAEGCGGGQQQGAAQPAAAPAASPAPTQAAPAQQSAAAPAPAAPAAAAPAGAGNGTLTTGQTLKLGEHTVFLSALSDSAATLYVVGSGRKTVEAGQSADLGNGCAVKVDRIENRSASLSGTGC